MTPTQFAQELSAISLPNVFNPYSDVCPEFDHPNAPVSRTMLLIDMLEAAIKTPVDSIWIGRDLGYRGGRRTGLALTDDIHLAEHGARWGVKASRQTIGAPVAERTAAVIWSQLSRISAPVFLWNVFPFHPHDACEPLSNRSHNAVERRLGVEILAQLVDMIRPSRLVAVGGDAAAVTRAMGITNAVFRVRHPSYGGHKDFVAQTRSLYKIPSNEIQPTLF